MGWPWVAVQVITNLPAYDEMYETLTLKFYNFVDCVKMYPCGKSIILINTLYK